MEVSLSLNGWSIWVFFFFFFSYDLLCHCVFVLKGRNDLINKKIKVWFWSYQCSLLSFGQIRWKSNGYYADLRGWANGGGGRQKAALQGGLVQANKADFLLWFWSFSWQRWSCLQPMPPPLPFATSLKLVHIVSFTIQALFFLRRLRRVFAQRWRARQRNVFLKKFYVFAFLCPQKPSKSRLSFAVVNIKKTISLVS